MACGINEDRVDAIGSRFWYWEFWKLDVSSSESPSDFFGGPATIYLSTPLALWLQVHYLRTRMLHQLTRQKKIVAMQGGRLTRYRCPTPACHFLPQRDLTFQCSSREKPCPHASYTKVDVGSDYFFHTTAWGYQHETVPRMSHATGRSTSISREWQLPGSGQGNLNRMTRVPHPMRSKCTWLAATAATIVVANVLYSNLIERVYTFVKKTRSPES